MALLEPAGSKKSRYQGNIAAGNSPYHLPAKTDGSNFLYQRGAELGSRTGDATSKLYSQKHKRHFDYRDHFYHPL